MADIVIDTWCQKDCTLGRLSYGDFKCFTLELPWRHNAEDISCIPHGQYLAEKYHSPTKGDVLLLLGVENRTYIEMHAGNYTRDVLGCILLGQGIKYLDGDSIPDVVTSKVTLNMLLAKVPDSVTVVVNRTGAY